MSKISQEQLNNIRTSVDIVDVISRYIPLTHKGSNYWGVCPFHQDTNPSMCVSPEKQIYTCFVCHKTGNVYNFVMDYEHVSFIEAVSKVADVAGIKLDIKVNNDDKFLNNNLYKIYDDTEKIYQNNLNTKLGEEARKYLNNRGIDESIIKEFGIGLSLKKRDILVKSFANKKYSINDLVDSGLVVKNEYGCVDIYQNRIMFPLWDLNGRIVGFSGRIYDTLEGSKYINSKETKIFKKRELLYNYHRAKDICRQLDTVIVMEGFMDVIGLYKEGITNTIAMMGTAVTKYQANLVKHMAHNVILLFDGDNAGVNAAMRSIDEFLALGVTPKVVQLENDLDPDEYIKKYGKDRFLSKINTPMNIMDFKLKYLKKDKDLSSDVEKANYVNNVLKQLESVKDDILIELTLKKLSNETSLDVEFLRSKLVKPEEIVKPIVKVKVETKKTSKYDKATESFIYYMLTKNDAVKIYDEFITYISIDKYRFLARYIAEYYKNNKGVDVAGIIDSANGNEEILNTIGEVMSLSLKEDITYEELKQYAFVIQKGNIIDNIKKIENEMKNESDIIKKAELAEQIRKLKVRGNSYV